MKNKNEIFRWIIVALCGFEVYRLAKTIISTITNYKQQLSIIAGESELIKNYKIATPIQIVVNIITVLALLAVIYYFVFCFGKQIKTKLLASAVLVNSICFIPLFLSSFITNYKLYMDTYIAGEIFYQMAGLSSFLEILVKYLTYLIVSIAIFKNIQNNKSIKITGIVLFVTYILSYVLNLGSTFMFYYTFSENSESIMSVFYSQINIMTILTVLLDLYILLYVFFMDKDYKRVKQIEE
ncbi:MAG: hypothetical protein IJD90_06485 [Clostridia bacterium]|nr:hypothetical protein [Clostridia bacterium]